MEQDLKKRIEELEKKVMELSNWKLQRSNQQIAFPLDIVSLDVIQNNLPVFSQEVTGTTTANKTLKLVINGKTYSINVR